MRRGWEGLGKESLDGLLGSLMGSRSGGLQSHLAGCLLSGQLGCLSDRFEQGNWQWLPEGLEHLLGGLGCLESRL